MNHGRPAAGTIPLPAQRSRSAARSASDCAHVRSSAASAGRLQPRRRAPPGGERRVPLAPIVAQPCLERGGVELRCPVQEPLHGDAELPALAGREPQPVARGALRRLRRAPARDARACAPGSPRPRTRRCARPSSARAATAPPPTLPGAPRSSTRLTAKMSAKSDASSSSSTASTSRSDRFQTVTASSRPRPTNSSRRTASPAAQSQLEDPDVRRALLERDRLAAVAVDRQHRARQKARVRGEEPGRRRDAVDVAALVADDERRPVEERQPHAVGSQCRLSTDRLAAVEIEEVQPAEVDRELDRLVGPHASPTRRAGRRRSRGSRRASALISARSSACLHVDEPLEHVLDEHGLRLDLDVHELLGAERLDRLDASAQPASVVAVAPAGLVERLRPDADRDRLARRSSRARAARSAPRPAARASPSRSGTTRPSPSRSSVAFEHVHRRAADEARDEQVRRPLVQALRRVELLQQPRGA